MMCKGCGKRFSIAGNIRKYKVVCPCCGKIDEWIMKEEAEGE